VIDVAHRLRFSAATAFGLLAHLSRDWVEIGEGSKVEEHYLSLPPWPAGATVQGGLNVVTHALRKCAEVSTVEPTVVTVAGKRVTAQNRAVTKQTIARTIFVP
jgi:hypothetical protein